MYNYHAIFLYMNKVNIADARAHLSRYLARVEAGETITLCRRNRPIAEIRPIDDTADEPRPIGIDRGMTVPDSFFDPLPEGLQRGHGSSGGDPERSAGIPESVGSGPKRRRHKGSGGE